MYRVRITSAKPVKGWSGYANIFVYDDEIGPGQRINAPEVVRVFARRVYLGGDRSVGGHYLQQAKDFVAEQQHAVILSQEWI